jgi:hypothetical protein
MVSGIELTPLTEAASWAPGTARTLIRVLGAIWLSQSFDIFFTFNRHYQKLKAMI